MSEQADTVYVAGYGHISKRLRRHWVNVTAEPDAAILAIDALEDQLAFADEEEQRRTYEIRQAITRFEYCHHKAWHRLDILVRSIGAGRFLARPSTAEAKRADPDVQQWSHALRILRAWAQGDPLASTHDERAASEELSFCDLPARELVAHLGPRTPLKVWQVGRLADRVEYGFLSFEGPAREYVPFGAGPQAFDSTPEEVIYYRQTVARTIQDMDAGLPRTWNLAEAIDLYAPCSWNYKGNLVGLLQVIGGQSCPDSPLLICAGGFEAHPRYPDFVQVKQALSAYWEADQQGASNAAAQRIQAMLGQATAIKIWLVRSLERTLGFPCP